MQSHTVVLEIAFSPQEQIRIMDYLDNYLHIINYIQIILTPVEWKEHWFLNHEKLHIVPFVNLLFSAFSLFRPFYTASCIRSLRSLKHSASSHGKDMENDCLLWLGERKGWHIDAQIDKIYYFWFSLWFPNDHGTIFTKFVRSCWSCCNTKVKGERAKGGRARERQRQRQRHRERERERERERGRESFRMFFTMWSINTML